MAVQKKEENKKNAILTTVIILWGLVFLFMKINIIGNYAGTLILTLLYLYMNFNLINLFFTSKRTTFKIYIFMLLDFIYLLRESFSLFSIFIYFTAMGILVYLIMKDEGKNKLPEIYQFAGFYTTIKIIFISMLIFL